MLGMGALNRVWIFITPGFKSMWRIGALRCFRMFLLPPTYRSWHSDVQTGIAASTRQPWLLSLLASLADCFVGTSTRRNPSPLLQYSLVCPIRALAFHVGTQPICLIPFLKQSFETEPAWTVLLPRKRNPVPINWQGLNWKSPRKRQYFHRMCWMWFKRRAGIQWGQNNEKAGFARIVLVSWL